PAVGARRRQRRGGGCRRRRRAAEECRRTLPRNGTAAGSGRRAGVPVLLLHLRPEPAVSRTRPAQARAAGRTIRRKIAWGVSVAGGPATPSFGSGRALQLLGAFAVIAAALLDPFQATIAIGRLVGVVLVDAGVHACLAFALLGIFRIDRGRIYRRARRRCG